MDDLKRLENVLKLRMSSPHTIRTYLYWNRRLLDFTKKSADDVSSDDIESFLANRVGGASPKTIVLIIAALKFFYKDTLKKDIVKIELPKIPKSLPVVLTREEVGRLVKSVENEKHRLIVKLLYSSGIRVSELTTLKVGDLELDGNFGWVRRGKGMKDRLFLLAKSLSKELEDYIKSNGKTSGDSLFNGRNGRMSSRNVQKIVESAAKEAGIGKAVHPHTLRHSLATHMLEDGINIRKIQTLLGHENISTTEIYTHISTEELKKIKNPLDDLF